MAVIDVFREAQQDEVAAFVLGIQQGEFDVPVTLEDQPDLKAVGATFLAGGGGFWVGTHDGRVVGTAGLLDAAPGLFVLRKMFVDQAHRGVHSGLAAALLARAVAHVRARGGGAIYLGTMALLGAACRFYEKRGFTRVDADQLPRAFPRMHNDDRFYFLAV